MFDLGFRLGFFTSAKSGEELPQLNVTCETINTLTERAQFICGYYEGYRINKPLEETTDNSAIIAEIFELIGELP